MALMIDIIRERDPHPDPEPRPRHPLCVLAPGEAWTISDLAGVPPHPQRAVLWGRFAESLSTAKDPLSGTVVLGIGDVVDLLRPAE